MSYIHTYISAIYILQDCCTLLKAWWFLTAISAPMGQWLWSATPASRVTASRSVDVVDVVVGVGGVVVGVVGVDFVLVPLMLIS